MLTAPGKNISIAERENLLWVASRQYMRGEISLEELEDIEHQYALLSTPSVPIPDALVALTSPSPPDSKERGNASA